MTTLKTIRQACRLHARLAACCLAACATTAFAQEAPTDASPTDAARSPVTTSVISLGSIASIDMSIGPDHRPHRALRFRFDSATRAMRSMGFDADECATVLRSSRHPSAVASDASHLGLTVALNCRFF